MTGDLSRRRFFRLVGGAPAVVASQAMAANIPKPTGPLTPGEYLEEMAAIGWRVYATVYLGRPQHVVEFCHDEADKAREGSLERYRDTFAEFQRIHRRVDQSGADFWERCSQYLFDRGLRHEVGPGT